MDRAEALQRLADSDYGHLGTVRPDGRPHLVPVTFAVVADMAVTMIDHKPKTTTRLQRLANVEANGLATLLVDHYSDDWSHLWWVRIDGTAELHLEGTVWEESVRALVEKYTQYREGPPQGPAIAVAIDRVNYWESTP